MARDGVPVFHKAYGFSDRANKIPNTVRTRFNIGSINKTFTQVAINQLVRDGKLAYSDTLGKFFPDYPQATSREATIEQLLRHTGGVAELLRTGLHARQQGSISLQRRLLPLRRHPAADVRARHAE